MTLKLGTRRSALAWAQSGQVAEAIGPDVERVGVETEGDRLVDVPLRGALAKGFFTEALERGLRDGTLDLAVHSLKDLPVRGPDGLVLGAIPRRASAADLLLIRPEAWNPEGPGLPLRPGARVGASAPRRQALLRAVRPDAEPAFLRGNVTTRLERLAEGRFDAIFLAEAGIGRLGVDLAATGARVVRLSPWHWPPAPGQGALAVQCRADDAPLRARLAALHDPAAAAAVQHERGWLELMGGGCAVPFGAYAEGERWVVGLEAHGRFGIRRGEGEGAEAAVRALLDGAEGEGWSRRIWEVIDVGA